MWEIAVHLAVACDVYDGLFLLLSLFPRTALDEILDLIESISEGLPTDFRIDELFNENLRYIVR